MPEPSRHQSETAPAARAGVGLQTVRIPLYHDLVSSICYVAHRVVQRMQPELQELGVELEWTPLDLAALLGWPRGHPVSEPRRRNAARVARELEVPIRVPPLWLDSREAQATALALDDPAVATSWRERVFSAVFEEGLDPGDRETLERLWSDFGCRPDGAALGRGRAALAERTRRAAQEMVTGVPTFMLGSLPFGGIQSEQTMRSVLSRYARKQRAAGRAAS